MNRIPTALALCLLAVTFILAQQSSQPNPTPLPKTYEAAWKQIDSLTQKGLLQSALTQTNALYERAKSEKNYPQLAKASIGRGSLTMQLDPAQWPEHIKGLERDIRLVPEPARSVLQSVLGDAYVVFYQRNRYRIYDRSHVTDTAKSADSTDLTTWDGPRIAGAARRAYVASITNETVLPQTPLSSYAPVVQSGDKEGERLHPTLFDLLAHRAIAFFQNTEFETENNVFHFELNRADYFANPDVFAKLALTATPSTGQTGRMLALQTYQRLLAFHTKQGAKAIDALVEADLGRLRFVRQYSTVADKDSLYQQNLERQMARWKGQPAEAQYAIALAQLLQEHGGQYQPLTKPGTKGANKRAADLCRDIIRRFAKTRAAQQAQVMLDQLTAPLIGATVEAVNDPQKPFLARIEYRNVPQIHYRLYKITSDERFTFGQLGYQSEEQRNKLLTQLLTKPVATDGKTTLPDDGDLNQHSVEMPINGVPVGQYVLLISGDATFSPKAKNLATALMTVSNLGFVMNNTYGSNNDRMLYVTDRQTGQPLPNISVQLLKVADRSGNVPRLNPGETRQTDANGRVVFPKTDFSQNQQVYFRISQGNDVLFTDNQYIYNNQQQLEEFTVQKAILFTDRAIYRPGQPIYVKGLLYEGRNNQFTVMAKANVELILNDANGENVATLKLTTNEFGSFTGTFTAPVGRLTGGMTIACEYGQTQIRVEEYKRPTFAVKADTIRQAIRLGQTVRVSAKAQTFSGANVDGASVRYRITRTYVQPLYGGWGGWGRSMWPPRQSSPTEITNGETTTDATGAISLSFVAAPDGIIPGNGNPTFMFEVTLDVTDRAGETRSTTQSLQIGYTALQAILTIPDQIEQGDTKTYAVKATNQAGIPVAIRQGEVIITRLQAPNQPLRKRLWERPDRQLLTETDFKKLFPNDVYADEDNPLNWPQTRVLTAQPQAVSLRTLAPGEYVAETTVTDSAGEKATQRQFFSVVDERTASQRPDAWVRATKAEVEPGQEAVFFVGNTQPGWVLMTVEEKNQLPRTEWIKTDGAGTPSRPKRVTIPVTEKQRGGFVVSFAMMQQGRLLTETWPIQVPFTNKQLTIETLTFRDKLKPGQADEWTIRISGPDKDKVVAEMVAALYDASLDEIVPHQWQTSIYESYQGGIHQWQSNAFSQIQASQLFYRWEQRPGPVAIRYPMLLSVAGPIRIRGGMARMAKNADMAMAAAPMAMEASAPGIAQDAMALKEVVTVGYGGPVKQPATPAAQPILRKNFNETAFFFPQLQTDSEGRVLLKFTMPDALTRWKLLTFAHTKDLKTGLLTREIVTQKELMVTLNPPRFLREQDTIRLSARINNLTGNALSGTAKLEAFDAMTDQPISQSVGLSATPVSFSAGPNGSASAVWTVRVPTGLPPVAFRVSATSPMRGSGSFTDAEERVVPVLPNRMLVTDAFPFWVNGKETRTFNLSALTGLTANNSVQHERLTVEVTSNPAWTALQSLPYLMEYPYECAEQIVSRLYANYLASSLIDSKPEFRRVIDGWATNPPKNPLASNAELKAVTLENSPWLADAKSEAERTARLGQLFDKNRLANEQRIAVEKLRQLQADNGGFRWFSGMEPNLTMTLHVLTVMGRIQALNSANGSVQPAVDMTEIQNKAIQYADTEMKRWVAEHQKQKNPSPSAYLAVQYLYARTVSPQPNPDKAVIGYLQKLIVKNWLSESLQGQALAVLALARSGDKKTAQGILASLKERAKTSEELGMYWPQNQPGTYWYQTPIETEAYLIEAFGTVGQDQVAVQEMKKWLLRQKQTQSWPSTKATTEAINALLQGPTGTTRQSTWLATGVSTDVLVGGQPLTARTGKEATTPLTPLGYQKTTYSPAEIKPELGNIRITKNADGPAWGALYWQRFEPLDKIKSSSTSLSVVKTLFVQRDTPNGPVIEPLTAKTTLKPGALLKVRLVIKTDRLMEYVHLKDSRASGFEPITVLSGYKYRNGLGYYEAPRDASTDFFIGSLPIGTHVFEYDLRVVQPGDFSAGVATIQCFYAPEFSAHSTGTRVNVN